MNRVCRYRCDCCQGKPECMGMGPPASPGVAAIVLSLGLCMLTISGLAAAQSVTNRIIDGTVVPENKYPFMVSVYFRSKIDGRLYPGCGGSHLGNGWVLTAAHCLLDSGTDEAAAPADVAVLLGTNDLRTEDAFFTPAQRLIIHPDYDQERLTDDIALIEMTESFDGSAITLPPAKTPLPAIGEQAIVAGWGHTEEGGQPSVLLQEVSVPIVSHAGCFPFFRSSFDRDKNFCAGGGADGSKDSCQGDSGGPIFVPRDELWIQAGIVSNGIGCGRSGTPALYTLVSSYTEWILSTIGNAYVWNDVGTSNITDTEIPKIAANSATETTVLLGATAVYDVSGATRIELTSRTGDADLAIYSGVNFREAVLDCISNDFTEDSALDACDITNEAEFHYAAVFGFELSDYELRRVDSGAQDQNADDIPVTPATQPDDSSQLASNGGGGGSASILLILLSAAALYLGVNQNRREKQRTSPQRTSQQRA